MGGTVEDYWGPSKRLLGDMKFLEGLLLFDKDNIPPAIMKKLHDRMLHNEEFDPEKVKTASTACEGLCKWIIAISKYDVVAKIVAPKKLALAKAEAEYNTAMAALEIKRQMLRDVQEKVNLSITIIFHNIKFFLAHESGLHKNILIFSTFVCQHVQFFLQTKREH